MDILDRIFIMEIQKLVQTTIIKTVMNHCGNVNSNPNDDSDGHLDDDSEGRRKIPKKTCWANAHMRIYRHTRTVCDACAYATSSYSSTSNALEVHLLKGMIMWD